MVNGISVFVDGYFFNLLAGNRMVSRINKMKQPLDVSLGFLGLYYLLEFDCPQQYEGGLAVLHYFIFGDRSIPGDMLASFTAILHD